MRLVWYDALLNWLPARLVPEGAGNLVVIGNGKVTACRLSFALCDNINGSVDGYDWYEYQCEQQTSSLFLSQPTQCCLLG